MKYSSGALIGVVIAHQSSVYLDNQQDHTLLDLDSAGESWSRKLIRKLVNWNIFEKVLVLIQEDVNKDLYLEICAQEGVELRLIPADLYIWPRMWYPWALNFPSDSYEIPMAWIHWIQKNEPSATYFALNVTNGFLNSEQMIEALKAYRKGHKAALINDVELSGYLVDSEYLNILYSTKFEGLPLLCDFPAEDSRDQIITYKTNKEFSYQSRIPFSMSVSNKRHLNLLKSYLKEYPKEVTIPALNDCMTKFLKANYHEDAKTWLNILEIEFTGPQEDWISTEHFDEICRQASNYGKISLILDFNAVSCESDILHWLKGIKTKLFLVIKVSANITESALQMIIWKADYIELSLPENLNFKNQETLQTEQSIRNWELVFNHFSHYQKPCLGLAIKIPTDSEQAVAMLNYFKDRREYNPILMTERLQGAEYPRAHVIKYTNELGCKIEQELISELGILRLDSRGRSKFGKTVYEVSLAEQLSGSL